MDTFGKRLKYYISEKFGNIKEFAQKVGIAPAQITFYLNDTRFPGGEILKKFADTGCNVNWLLTGKGEMLLVDFECKTTPPISLFENNGTPDFINIDFLSQTAPPWLYYYSLVTDNSNPDIPFKKNDILILRKITMNDPMFDLNDNGSPQTEHIVRYESDYKKEYGTAHSFDFVDFYEDDSNIKLGRDYFITDDNFLEDIPVSEEWVLKVAYSVEYLIRRTVKNKDPFAGRERRVIVAESMEEVEKLGKIFNKKDYVFLVPDE